MNLFTRFAVLALLILSTHVLTAQLTCTPIDTVYSHFFDRSTPDIKTLGSSYNIFSVLTVSQNQVVWNPELNTIVFGHRQNSGTVGGSGGLSFDASLDGGNTWSTNTIISPDYNSGISTSVGNRYPNTTLYNPVGNTDPAQAYVISSGPALETYPVSDIDWGLQTQISSKLDGSAISEVYIPGHYLTYGLSSTPDGTLWSLSTSYDGPTGDATNHETVYINKGVFDSFTEKVNWTTIAFSPSYYVSAGSLSFGFDGNIAFSPDGQTGYAIYMAAESVTPNTAANVPQIYKSTDAGLSWFKLAEFDFQQAAFESLLSELMPTVQGIPVPNFSESDISVDNEGKLHLLSLISPKFTTAVDSFSFIWVGENTQKLYHFTTTDGTDWTSKRMPSYINQQGELTGTGTSVTVTAYPQIARTSDGSKVFFTWAQSPTEFVTSNLLPNIFLVGYDVASDNYTGAKITTRATSADGIAHYPTLAPLVKESGTAFNYELVQVYAEPNVAGPLSAPQYHYLGETGLNDTDFLPSTDIEAIITPSSASIGGAITINMNSGLPPYEYRWYVDDGGATFGGNSISDLTPGFVQVRIVDADNNSVFLGFEVPEETGDITVTEVITPATTTASSDGAIDITVDGCFPPFSYSWSTGAVTEDISGLSHGVYFVSILDAMGNSDTLSFAVGTSCQTPVNLTAIPASTSAMLDWDDVAGATAYRVKGMRTGGTGGKQKLFTVSNGMINILLPETSYSWTVRAICGPINSAFNSGENVFTTAALRKAPELVVQIQPNPADQYISINAINHLEDELLQCFDLNGKLMHSGTWNSGSTAYGFDVSNWPNGNYLVKVGAESMQVIIQH